MLQIGRAGKRVEDGSEHREPAVAAAVRMINKRWDCLAQTAVILGTGLGDLADEISAATTISYSDIPGFPRSTALAHKGRLVCGELCGKPILAMQGRCHRYEGYPHSELRLPVQVLAALGVKRLVITNAAGGLNPAFAVGDVMQMEDHISFMGWIPTGHVDSHGFGRVPRAANSLYCQKLASLASATARRDGFPLQRGVYVGVTGPSYETRAEYRVFRRLGGDAVGMSTIPEVVAASSLRISILGLSTITNVATPDMPKVVSAAEVVSIAELALPRVRAIIRAIVSSPSDRLTEVEKYAAQGNFF